MIEFSLFTVPCGFSGAYNVRQCNAIDTWVRLDPKPEILLIGDECGTESIAEEYNLVHVPGVELSPLGVPLVSSTFWLAQQSAKYDIICYVNADIMLFQGFVTALARVVGQLEQFLMIGQRIDLDLDTRLETNKESWQRDLMLLARTQGELHDVRGIDYFAFRRGLYGDIPPYVIGRYCWDNWLVVDALERDVPVVDTTQGLFAIHQNHERRSRNNDDYRRNRALYKGRKASGKHGRVSSATWVLDGEELKRK